MWSTLIENTYLNIPSQSHFVMNVVPDKFSQQLSVLKINKLVSEDSLKLINFLDDVRINLLISTEILKK